MLTRFDSTAFAEKGFALLFTLCLSYIIIVELIYEHGSRFISSQTTVHLNTYNSDLGALDNNAENTAISSRAETEQRFIESRVQFKLDDTGTPNIGESKKTKAKTKIRIVVYFPHQVRISNEISQLKMNKCENKNCLIQQMFVQINGSISDADAVVFQGNNMPKLLPVRRDTEQVFVFLNNEPPMYIQIPNLNRDAFHNYFNWTMTYRRDSDIPLLYGEIGERKKHLKEKVNTMMKSRTSYTNDINTAIEKDYSYIFKRKNKNAFWIVSHCLTKSKRENYIYQMMSYTEIDQFGLCNKKYLARKSYALDKMSEQYKFYLAFENTFCNDYITEKVFNWFASDLVLVVRGGCDYSKFLPKGTYIDANNFTTPAELAHFLTNLGKNEREYIRILKRKDEYHVIKELDMVQLAFCNLCSRLNNVNRYRKSISNIYSWWQENSCWKPMDL